MTHRRRAPWLAAAALAGAVALGGLALLVLPADAPQGQAPLYALSQASGLDPLRDAFNAAADRGRLLLLLSPT